MRCLFLVSFLIFVVVSGMLGGGCASREPPHPTWRLGEHQKRLEKQQAESSVADAALTNLPEMTAEEYETVGDTYLQQRNLAMAFVHYDKALRLAPRQLSLRYKTGLIFLKRGLAEDALRAFQEVLKTDDTFALAYEGLGQAFVLREDVREAEKHFQRALALDASLWKSYNSLGMLYDQQQRFAEAIASYKAALALQQENGLLYNNLGVSYYRQGDYENALRVFEKALHMGYTGAKVYNNLGLSLAKLGRYQEALLAFIKGGDKIKAYNNLGVIYVTEGKYKEATAAFAEALALSPRYYATAHENLRVAQQALGASPASSEIRAVPSGEGDPQAAR
jgi:tetratricopeptide (TPR) repeat protein